MEMSDVIGYFNNIFIFLFFLLNLSALYCKLECIVVFEFLNYLQVTSLRSNITFAVLIPYDDTQTDRPL